MTPGHLTGYVDTEEIVAGLTGLQQEAASSFAQDFQGDFSGLVGRLSAPERVGPADLAEIRRALAELSRKVDGKLLQLSQSAADIQERVERREEAKLLLEKQKVSLQKIQLVLGLLTAFLTGLFIPYLARLLGITP